VTVPIRTHLLHGLRISTEVHLPEPVRQIDGVDLAISWGDPRNVPDTPGAGTVVAELVTEERRWYTATEETDGYLLRFHGTADVLVSADLSTARCHVDPSTDATLLSVLMSGTALALILELAGDAVLHASAVEMAGMAVGIVGTSGMGKSTTAAMLCSAGAALVTDDVLRVELGEEARCHRGASGLRLRDKAIEIAGLLGGDARSEPTPDSRLGLFARQTSALELGLAALVLPRPSRDITNVVVDRIPAVEAALLLARFPRVYGMRRPADVRRQFGQRTRIVEAVPFLRADVPWGPPFDPSVGADLMDSITAALR
jgi:hypothetical protein